MRGSDAACALAALALAGAAAGAGAQGFSGPAEWRLVNTNAVRAWQAAQEKAGGPALKAWPGVVCDTQAREVRLLAEAVGHREGLTVEFLLVGPQSDRAYEAAAVTVASPGDIARAVEALGVARGGGVGSAPFRFWPRGERVAVTVRRADEGQGRPLQSLVSDANAAEPLLGEGGLVFTGGRWPAASVCATDTNLPCAVVSLYNDPGTVFDVPRQVAQSDVYGRLTLAERLPFGALLVVTVRPLPPEGGGPRVLPLAATAAWEGGEVVLTVSGPGAEPPLRAKLADALAWLRAKSEAGREIFLTLGLDDALPLGRAVDVARVFGMLDGKGVKLDGKAEGGVYPRAFLPQEKWRERKDRVPQPFELRLTPGEGGRLQKRLVFIEEDWNVEGLDPKLTPRDYPFEAWDELPGLVRRAGGEQNKVPLLLVFAPAEQPLGVFMPGVRALAERLPLVYIFAE